MCAPYLVLFPVVHSLDVSGSVFVFLASSYRCPAVIWIRSKQFVTSMLVFGIVMVLMMVSYVGAMVSACVSTVYCRDKVSVHSG